MLPPFRAEGGDEVIGGLRRAAAGFVDVTTIGQRTVDLRLDDVQRDLDEVGTVRTVIGDAKRFVGNLDVSRVWCSVGSQKFFVRDGLANGQIPRIDVARITGLDIMNFRNRQHASG